MTLAAVIDNKGPDTAEYGRTKTNACSMPVMMAGQDVPEQSRILTRLRPERGEGPQVPLLREALDEARRDGTFSHLAPILEGLARAHEDFFNHAAEVMADRSFAEMQFPYGRVRETFDEAVNRVMPFLPPDSVRFDKQYPWDGRHESRVLYRDLRQPMVAHPQFSPRTKVVIMAGEVPFPYQYGSDLHWLWGWGERLRSLLSDDVPPSKYDWMVFRPDRLARDAMMRFSVKYPHVIKQIDDYLDFANARFEEFLSDDNDSTRADFSGAMDSLCERIRVGVETIAQSEGASDQPEPIAGQQSPSRPDEPTDSEAKRVRDQVFISYSRKDKRWLDDLLTHLKPHLRDGSVTAWSDQQITTGSKWFSEIQAALAGQVLPFCLSRRISWRPISFTKTSCLQSSKKRSVAECESCGFRFELVPSQRHR